MILWFDCETTGIDEKRGSILEVALVITDNALEEKACYQAVIAHGELTLDLTLTPWAKENHLKTGLLKELRESVKSTAEVERELIALINTWCPEGSKAILAGASIPFDRKFIASDMPHLNIVLDSHTYRMLDVSGLKEMFSRQFNISLASDEVEHRAMSDIRSSLNQYKQYLKIVEAGVGQYVFKGQ